MSADVKGGFRVSLKPFTKRNTVRVTGERMITQVVSAENMKQAYTQVLKNKGAAGIGLLLESNAYGKMGCGM